MNRKHKSKRLRPKRVSIPTRPIGQFATEPNDPMVALANSAASPAPRLLTTEELVKLAKKMCAEKNPKSAEKLRVKFMEGFYGRHFLPEELRLPPPSREELAREEQEWIRKIRNGEAREV